MISKMSSKRPDYLVGVNRQHEPEHPKRLPDACDRDTLMLTCLEATGWNHRIAYGNSGMEPVPKSNAKGGGRDSCPNLMLPLWDSRHWILPVVRCPNSRKAVGIAFLEEIRINPAGTATGAAMNAARNSERTQDSFAVWGKTKRATSLSTRAKSWDWICSMVQRTDKIQTSSTILAIRPNGDRPCLHCRGASDHLFINEEDFRRCVRRPYTSLWRYPDLSGPWKAAKVKNYSNMQKQMDWLRHSTLIGPEADTVDKLRKLLPHVDYFMPSMEEAEQNVGGFLTLRDIGQFFMDIGARICVFKWGPNGSFVKSADMELRVPAFKVRVFRHYRLRRQLLRRFRRRTFNGLRLGGSLSVGDGRGPVWSRRVSVPMPVSLIWKRRWNS